MSAVLSDAEHARFKSAIPRSWDAVWPVARYLHSLGGLSIRIEPLRIREDRDFSNVVKGDSEYGDKADLFVQIFGHEKWWPVEVKWRTLSFSSRDNFPHETIFVDRRIKCDSDDPPFAYFTVSKELSHAALIRQTTRSSWLPATRKVRSLTLINGSYFYNLDVYECPKGAAEFVSLP